MSKLNYTKKEKVFLEKWGAKAELQFDTVRTLFSPITGKRITALDSAKARKKAIQEISKLKLYKST